jgi:hypothetical protein
MPNGYENPLNPANQGTPYEAAKKPKDETQFYNQVGSGVKALTAVPNDMLRANESLYYRSDDRPTSEIFRDGFAPRDGQGIVYRLMKQDIHPHTAVCVTGSLDAAALFPVKVDRSKSADIDPSQKEAPEETRIYVVAPKALFDTHDVQARFAARIMPDQGAEQQTMGQGNLYGQERAAQSIAPEDVLCAITVKRTWRGADYTEGGSYTITGVERNPGADPRHLETLKEMMSGLQENGKLPTSADIPKSAHDLVDAYAKSRDYTAHVGGEKPDTEVLKAIKDGQSTAREGAAERMETAREQWRIWKDAISNPDQGIAADTPVTVRRIDDKNAFLGEIEKFEMRMTNTDEVGSQPRKKLYDTGENSENAQGYVAYKGDAVVGWMTLTAEDRTVRIEKICSDSNPLHDRGVGQALIVQAVEESRATGKGGELSVDSADALKYGRVDGRLFNHMGFHMDGDNGKLHPYGRSSDYPQWSSVDVDSGRTDKHGRMMMQTAEYRFHESADEVVRPVPRDQLTPPQVQGPVQDGHQAPQPPRLL